MARTVTKVCQNCGKDFQIASWELKESRFKRGLYCSKSCLYETMRGKPMPRKIKPPKTILHAHGYILEWVGYDYPGAQSGRMLQHRLVMERFLGRSLTENEEVHHINEDKTDNRIENLKLVSSSTHQSYHNNENSHNRKPKVIVRCEVCDKTIQIAPWQAKLIGTSYQKKYCSLACKQKAWGKLKIVNKRWNKATVKKL